MACFTIPAAEAIITTIAAKVIKKKELSSEKGSRGTEEHKPRFSERLKWLNNMLWGGSALLAFEHIWHGEVVPFPPFLTAMNSPDSTSEMLHEMSTVGVGMAVLVTGVWAVMAGISYVIEKRSPAEADTAEVTGA